LCAKNYQSWRKFDKVMPKTILAFFRDTVYIDMNACRIYGSIFCLAAYMYDFVCWKIITLGIVLFSPNMSPEFCNAGISVSSTDVSVVYSKQAVGTVVFLLLRLPNTWTPLASICYGSVVQHAVQFATSCTASAR